MIKIENFIDPNLSSTARYHRRSFYQVRMWKKHQEWTQFDEIKKCEKKRLWPVREKNW
jgi:hypothetical protein